MADVPKIIKNLRYIQNANYNGPVTAQPTFHRTNFDRLQGSAQQVADILSQNPNPNRDQKENLRAQFQAIGKAAELYCGEDMGKIDILKAFQAASGEWELLDSEG
ncbi:MAG: hypothetical protein ACRD2B_16800 [Terriglobia bacterium]